MQAGTPIFDAETFRFFRDLGRNNSKAWMDLNRQRYKRHVVEPFRLLLDALTPGAQNLHPEFSVSGRTGENFSRINRDIRFANDKTPYYTHMYLFLSGTENRGRAAGQLYVGVSAGAVTVGFRIYYQSRQSAMACRCVPRAIENLAWLAGQRKKFMRKYESYWYAKEKGRWTRRSGWPRDGQEWKTAKGWVIRRKWRPLTALQPSFRRKIEETFRALFPLYGFSCLPEWTP